METVVGDRIKLSLHIAPRVFVPQVPSRWDAQYEMWVPAVNLAPAKRYGALVTCLPPQASRMSDTGECVRAMRKAMRDFQSTDYVAGVGSPAFIALAAAVAIERTGGELRMLVWDKQSTDYTLVEMEL